MENRTFKYQRFLCHLSFSEGFFFEIISPSDPSTTGGAEFGGPTSAGFSILTTIHGRSSQDNGSDRWVALSTSRQDDRIVKLGYLVVVTWLIQSHRNNRR